MKLYVGNLPFDFSEENIQELFSTYGTVVNIKVIQDEFSGRSRGFAFVEMSSRSEGHKAMETLNGTTVEHRDLVVNEAKPTKKRGSGRR